MAAKIICGDVFGALPTLAAGSVDVCVTSPPYWQLRDYGTGTWEGGNDPACQHKVRNNSHAESSTLGGGKATVGHSREGFTGTCPRCGARRIDKQLGMEPTPSAYVARMVEVFRLVRRAMAPHATCWLNIGDSYSGGTTGRRDAGYSGGPKCGSRGGNTNPPAPGIPDGNLCLIPQRLAIALQEDGWLCRSVIVWHKPAPMPGSMAGWRWARCRVKVKELRPRVGTNFDRGSGRRDGYTGGHISDNTWNQYAPCPGCPRCEPNNGLVLRRGKWRPTSSWEPVLMLAKGPNYYADGEAVKTPAAAATVARDRYTRVLDDPDEQFAVRHDHETVCEGGANLRDVWTIADPLMRLRGDLTAEQRQYVLSRLLAAGL